VNPCFTDIFGYAESEIIGKSGAELNLWDNPAQRQIVVDYLHSSKTVGNVDVILHHANGEPIYALLSAEVIELDDEPCILSFIQNVTELKQRTEMLQQYNERLEMLHQVDQAILNSVHPRVIAQGTLQQLKQIIPFYTASVIRFDYENNQAILLTLETEGKSDYQAGDSIPIEQSPILDQLQAKRPYIIHNTETATGLLDIERRVAASGIRSYLAAPLIYGDTLLGTLNLLSDKPDVFSEETVEIVL
jgi:PAS domain S-box-containing protein